MNMDHERAVESPRPVSGATPPRQVRVLPRCSIQPFQHSISSIHRCCGMPCAAAALSLSLARCCETPGIWSVDTNMRMLKGSGHHQADQRMVYREVATLGIHNISI
jgi:hypothetical protein